VRGGIASPTVAGRKPARETVVRGGELDQRQQRRLIACAWARELGTAQELGDCQGIYEYVYGRWSARGCGVFLIAVIVLMGALVLQLAGAARVAAVAVVGLALVSAIGLTRVTPRLEKADFVAVFGGGLAQQKVREPGARVIPWQRLRHLYLYYPGLSSDSSAPPWDLYELKVTSAEGAEITVGTGYHKLFDFANRHYANLDDLKQRLEQELISLKLPGAIAAYDSGMPVDFGHLSVSRQGITWDNGAGQAPWERIRWFEVWPHKIAIATDPPGRGTTVFVAGLPDSCLAVTLIREAAARHQIPERGQH
jgi:hypothetical protein